MTRIEIINATPLTTVQDAGRFGNLAHGVTASGPMDARAFARAGQLARTGATSGLEFGAGRLAFRIVGGPVTAGFAGGSFGLKRNGNDEIWPAALTLEVGDEIEIIPGARGNFGYVRFAGEIDVPLVMGSRSTSLIAALGGHEGRQLANGDVLGLIDSGRSTDVHAGETAEVTDEGEGPIRIIWGLHANRFSNEVRQRLVNEPFHMSSRLDRMGAGLEDISGVFTGEEVLSLVSDAVVPGDIQILGDGTPIALMRDHQPTGGYPRIATIITPDIDRLAQVRPGREIRFTSVTVAHAHAIAKALG